MTRATLLAAAVMAGVVLAFFAPALDPAKQFLHRDAGRMHHPMKRWIADELARGHLPAWNPYNGLGAPVIADAVNAPFHPFNALLVALPFEAGFKAWILLSYLVAAAGAWAWARALGRGPAASAAAGLATALGGFLVSSSDNLTYLATLAAAPWVLAVSLRAARVGGPGALAAVGVASLACAVGGDPQSWAIAAALASFQGALAARGAGLRPAAALRRAAAIAGTACLAAAPVLAPVIAWMPHSSRGEAFDAVEYARWNLHPLRLLELAIPRAFAADPALLRPEAFQVYLGSGWDQVPWVLSIYAGASVVLLAGVGAARARTARLALAAGAVLAWMAMGSWAGFGQIASRLPGLSGFRYWEKLAVWPGLALAIAAAYGVDAILAERARARQAAVASAIAAGTLLAGALLAAVAPDALSALLQRGDHARAAGALVANLTLGLRASGLVLAVLALLAWMVHLGVAPRLAPAALAALVALDLAVANAGAYQLSPVSAAADTSPILQRLRAEPGLQRVVTPYETPFERWPELAAGRASLRFEPGTLYSAWNVAHHVGNFETYAAMIPARAMRYRRRAGLVNQLPGVGLWGVSWTVVPSPVSTGPSRGLVPPYDVVLDDEARGALLVRIPSRPRAYLAQELATVDRRGAMEFALAGTAVATPRSVVEGPLPAGYSPPSGSAKIVLDEPERVDVAAETDRPSLLVLNDVFAGGWTAEVDGRPAGIVPANYLARGVWIGPGRHEVVFRFRTPGLAAGLALLAGGALVLLAWALLRRGAARRTATIEGS